MEETNNFQGLELLFKLLEGSLQSREDCLVAVVHIMMINRGNKCIGIGDDWPDNESTSASELLPDGWNANQEVYTLRYISSALGIKYLLKVVKAGSTFLLNVFNVQEKKVAGMSISIDIYIGDTITDFFTTFKNLGELSKAFQTEVVDKVSPKLPQTSDKESSETEQQGQSTQQQVPDHRNIEDVYPDPTSFYEPERVIFPSVGRGDLDPLGGGHGGGMLLDPRSMMRPTQPQFGIGGPAGLPRGAVPPGARFDPFGPPVGGRGRGRSYMPDPDHFLPPGFDPYM